MGRRITVESLSQIDVNELNHLGAFNISSPEWVIQFPFLGLKTSRFLIEYRGPNWPADWPPQRIPIKWTPCTYGGARPWFVCPCGMRVGKLYRSLAWLGCRNCADATYESQRKSRKGRLYLKATRIRARLGNYDRPGIATIPPRPSGMQRRIYSRLRSQAESIERELTTGRIYCPHPRRERRNYAFKA